MAIDEQVNVLETTTMQKFLQACDGAQKIEFYGTTTPQRSHDRHGVYIRVTKGLTIQTYFIGQDDGGRSIVELVG